MKNKPNDKPSPTRVRTNDTIMSLISLKNFLIPPNNNTILVFELVKDYNNKYGKSKLKRK